MNLLFDTNFLIEYSRNPYLPLFQDLIGRADKLFTSVICVAEFRVGLPIKRLHWLDKITEVFEPLDVTYEIAVFGGGLRQEFLNKGLDIPLPDHLIAATALRHNLALATFNKKDFPHKGLRLYPT
jgi:predicted nucleic acid-binding protein